MATAVATLADLDAVRLDPYGDYVQTADIDASPTSDPLSDYWNSGAGWEPLSIFGSYDGDGYAISNLFISSSSSSVGFLSMLALGGTVSNVTLTDVDIGGSGRYVGGLVARVYSTAGAITGCAVSGSVETTYSGTDVQGCGGIVGYGTAIITECDFDGTVVGYRYCGGIAGYLESDSAITKCRASGSIAANNHRSGGICGSCDGALYDCWADASVGQGIYNERPAGLVSYLRSNGSILRCGAVGAVDAGGGGGGGLVASVADATVTDSFWDTEATGQATSAGGTGKTTAQMQALATFADTATEGLTTAWSIARVSDWVDETWVIGDADGDMYPQLAWAYEAPTPSGEVVAVPVATITGAALAPTTTAPAAVAPPAATVSGAGLAATLDALAAIAVPAATTAGSSLAPTTQAPDSIAAALAQMTSTALPPTLTGIDAVIAPYASVTGTALAGTPTALQAIDAVLAEAGVAALAVETSAVTFVIGTPAEAGVSATAPALEAIEGVSAAIAEAGATALPVTLVAPDAIVAAIAQMTAAGIPVAIVTHDFGGETGLTRARLVNRTQCIMFVDATQRVRHADRTQRILTEVRN